MRSELLRHEVTTCMAKRLVWNGAVHGQADTTGTNALLPSTKEQNGVLLAAQRIRVSYLRFVLM